MIIDTSGFLTGTPIGNMKQIYQMQASKDALIQLAQDRKQQVAKTQEVIQAQEQKVQATLSPEVTRLFNIEFKTLVDLYA